MMMHNMLMHDAREEYMRGIVIDEHCRIKFDRRYAHLHDMPPLNPGDENEPQMHNDHRITETQAGELVREHIHEWVHGAGFEAWQIGRVQRGK